jgi:hypothetical protein
MVTITPPPPGKSPWYPLDRNLGMPQSWSGRGGEEKNPPPPCRDSNPPIIQPVIQRYTDWVIPAPGTYTMVQDILRKTDSHSACQTACFLYGTRRFVAVLTKVHHRILSWVKNQSRSEALWKITLTYYFFTVRGLLAPRPSSKLEDHALSVVRYCLFNTFTATLHIWRPSPLSTTREPSMSWW